MKFSRRIEWNRGLVALCLFVVSWPVEAQELVNCGTSDLEPLPIRHFSWPVALGATNSAELQEFVRITRAFSIRGEVSDKRPISYIIDELDAGFRAIRRLSPSEQGDIQIGINYSIWHRFFPASAKPTDDGSVELQEFRRSLMIIKALLSTKNSSSLPNVSVGAVLLDSERFWAGGGNAEVNAAIESKQRAAYEIAKEIFPFADVLWYGRGEQRYSRKESSWKTVWYLTLREPGDGFSVPLYSLPSYRDTWLAFEKTVEFAKTRGESKVTPWIALGAGYTPPEADTTMRKWQSVFDYDTHYSWRLGSWLSQGQRARMAPWGAAAAAVFYPSPFGSGDVWRRHFRAFVLGWMGRVQIAGSCDTKRAN